MRFASFWVLVRGFGIGSVAAFGGHRVEPNDWHRHPTEMSFLPPEDGNGDSLRNIANYIQTFDSVDVHKFIRML